MTILTFTNSLQYNYELIISYYYPSHKYVCMFIFTYFYFIKLGNYGRSIKNAGFNLVITLLENFTLSDYFAPGSIEVYRDANENLFS